MYKLLLTVAIFISAASYAQQTDSRLLVKYSQKEINKLQKEDPQQYQFLVNALNKGLFISEIPAEKEKGIAFDGELAIDPAGKHTFLSLHQEILDRYQYFRIKGTNQMVVILPKIFLEPKK